MRVAAGSAYQTLSKNIGQRAVDEIMPLMLTALSLREIDGLDNDDSSSKEIEGIRQMLSVSHKTDRILHHLIPVLIEVFFFFLFICCFFPLALGGRVKHTFFFF